ncbi:MAG: Uma2 family endonuclease [Planctomycetota bacterium]
MSAALAPSGVVVPAVEDDGTGPLFEVVDGVKVEKHMSLESQTIGFEIAFWLRLHLHEKQVEGHVVTEPFVVCFDWMPDTRRRPDVAYWYKAQYPDGIPAKGDASVAPALAIEVASPHDNVFELERKVGEYFRAGVQLVWIINPEARTVRTEQPDGTAHVYRDGDTLVGGPVLPKFTVEVAKLFAKTASSQTGV